MASRAVQSLIQSGASNPQAPSYRTGTNVSGQYTYDANGRVSGKNESTSSEEPWYSGLYRQDAGEAEAMNKAAFERQKQAQEDARRYEQQQQDNARLKATQDLFHSQQREDQLYGRDLQTQRELQELTAQNQKRLQSQSLSGAKSLQAQQAANELAFLNQRASLSDSGWDKRFGQVQGAIGQVGQNSVQHGSSGMQGNETAARAAAFARAKEQAGRTANAALASLKGMFEDSGTMGSTMEAAQAGQIIGGAGAGVNEFTRDQMISDLARAAEIEDAQYAGNITQRGQDNSMKQALLALMNSGPLY